MGTPVSSKVSATKLPHRYSDLSDHRGGVSVREARDAGVVPVEGAEPMDRHHIFPQSSMEVTLPQGGKVTIGGRSWFKERGIDIDEFCVDLSDFEHDRIHGVSQDLARKHWRGWEWRSAILDELQAEETFQAKANADPKYKLTPEQIWAIANRLRARFGIADRPFVHFTRSP